ncbi:MAG: hypothetical protein GEU79_09315 [Acidimicrobiia bacterium]|nr:hypothetical protein [Acidimicrobiia bacterium]
MSTAINEESGIEEAVAEAREADVALSVVVLDGTRDPESVAEELLVDLGGGTVMVFTNTDYWVASDEFDEDRLQELIDSSPALGSMDTVGGVEDFVAASTDEGFPWDIAIIAGLVIGVLLAIVGRSWRAWTTRSRRRDAAETHKAKLRRKLDSISDRILELSVPVQLAEDSGITNRFADVTDRYRTADSALEDEVEASKLDAIDSALTSVEEDLTIIEGMVEPHSEADAPTGDGDNQSA